MNGLVGYLTENCCGGNASACGTQCVPGERAEEDAKVIASSVRRPSCRYVSSRVRRSAQGDPTPGSRGAAHLGSHRRPHDGFFLPGSAAAPNGLVGLEFLKRDALLRSLVVVPEQRGSGLGSALVERAESHARARGARAIFLLTTTAERFFRSRGYVPADRATAPEAVRTSREIRRPLPGKLGLPRQTSFLR